MPREECIAVDFETEAIQPRPHYPPRPVGVSLLEPGERKPRYLAWGHPTNNNCTVTDARRALSGVWRDPRPKVFHNGKFDQDVAETHLGLRPLDWRQAHDTLFSLFLIDPYAPNLGLKPMAVKHLGARTVGRELAKDWLLRHVPEVRRKPTSWGAYICRLPGDLAGRYAADDTMFTRRLHEKLYPRVAELGMQAAYDRERRLLPLLLAQERRGVRIHVERLRRELPRYERALQAADTWLRRALGAPELNLDSNDDLVAALLRTKTARRQDFLMTPGGDVSASKESLRSALSRGNKQTERLFGLIGYRNRLTTCLTMFMRPWLKIALETGGTVHPAWHQVRQAGGEGGNIGARSGRLITSDPNLLNLSKDFEEKDDYKHPRWFRGLPELPLVRRYVIPARGARWGHRDYNQQELRIAAHYEDGQLLAAYNADPRLDVHKFVQDEIRRIFNVSMERRPVKILNFGMLYGMGARGTAVKLRCSYEQAQELKDAQRGALPGVRQLERAIKRSAMLGEPIRTWGGRLYWAEAPRIKDGEVRRFEYKLLNYLIQGSAADATKEAVIRYHEAQPGHQVSGHFDVTVYDEINCSMFDVAADMRRLKTAMESVEFDVKLVSDAKAGASWGELKKFTDTEEK